MNTDRVAELGTTGPVVDDPAVHAEVSAAFARYEAALLVGDHAVLNESFWASPATVRFGIADHQQGIDELRAWRATQGPLDGRDIQDTRITTFGTDTAVVTTLFRYPGRPVVGRQSQTWVRMAAGWRIVSAHVSEIGTELDQ
ncbi:oxalurate catabolism protein HpxZ [Amycolatopsis sp. NPDC021455]|uniref:oxalurate catabolism protein HpxZ n=1 Tax=Amycolatopsis sp. NPDC021455 TaxID=3154901 RepID=UPI0033CAC176